MRRYRTAIIPKRGMTLLELMIAITVTVMVGTAMVGMLNAVSVGVDGRRDIRAFMIQANAAQMRLSAFVAPSRCILSQQGRDLVLWFDDSRKSNTVHASEIRWLLYDSDEQAIQLFFVKFPDDWSDTRKQLNDGEYRVGSNWYQVLDSYKGKGLVSSVNLIDHVEDVAITLDQSAALSSRYVSYRLDLVNQTSGLEMRAAATIRNHRTPDF